jgi:hypothetical protein
MVTRKKTGIVTLGLATSTCIVFALALATAAENEESGATRLKLRPGMTGVPDLGAIYCETFNQMHPAGPTGMEQAVLTWAEGYFYGLSGKTIDEILAVQPAGSTQWNFNTLSGHIVAFCAAQPNASVPDAVADLWQRLQPMANDPGLRRD